MPTTQNLRSLAGPVRAELERAVLPFRHVRLAGLLIKATLARGRQSVLIPSLDTLGKPLQMDRPAVHAIVFGGTRSDNEWVAGLWERGRKILQVTQRADGGWLFVILPDSTQWDVTWHYERSCLEQWLRDLDAVAGQITPHLAALAPVPDLRDAMAEVSADRALFGAPIADEAPQQRDGGDPARSELRNRPDPIPVPALAVVAAGRSEFQNQSAVSSKPSGTKCPLRSPSSESAFSLETLNALKLKAAAGSENEVMHAGRAILGREVWEGRTDARPIGDGGKWRVRFRDNPAKVRRVFLDMIEGLARRDRYRKPGGRAEWLWQEFQ